MAHYNTFNSLPIYFIYFSIFRFKNFVILRAMNTKPHKTDTDAGRLKALFGKHANGLTQSQFGKKYRIGTQGMVWQYLNNKAPLNESVAVKFAKGLGIQVSDFSPRLAEKIAKGEGRVERIPKTIQIRPAVNSKMQEILVKRNNGSSQFKAYDLYEEALIEYIKRNGHKI